MAPSFSRALVVCLAVLSGSACSAPFPIDPPVVRDEKTGQRLQGLVSYCYGTEMNSSEEIRTTAAEACEGELVFVEQKMFLNECPLLQTVRVTYQCRAPGQGEGGGQSAAPRP